jgi:DNA-binding response OmpR family regulator
VARSRVLVVEDDRTMADVVKYNLAKEGYDVSIACDGAQALELARSTSPDLVLLDIMLPVLDGLEVCRILRQEMTVPIIMMTAKTEEIDRIVGLEVGADDYVMKPFSMRELVARVRAILRRTRMIRQEVEISKEMPRARVKSGDLEIDFSSHQVFYKRASIDLSPKEFDLLGYLVANRGIAFTRDQLLEKVWGYNYVGDTRTVDVHVGTLRRKIEDNPSQPKRLLTVRGIGYKFE